jgi:hypothetical protein
MYEGARKAGVSVRGDEPEVNVTVGQYGERTRRGRRRSAGNFSLNRIQELLHLEGFLERAARAQHTGHIEEV